MILRSIRRKVITELNFGGRIRVTELGRKKRDKVIYKSNLHRKKKMQVHLICLEQRMKMPLRQKIKLNKWSDATTQRALCAKPWNVNHILKSMRIHPKRVIY